MVKYRPDYVDVNPDDPIDEDDEDEPAPIKLKHISVSDLEEMGFDLDDISEKHAQLLAKRKQGSEVRRVLYTNSEPTEDHSSFSSRTARVVLLNDGRIMSERLQKKKDGGAWVRTAGSHASFETAEMFRACISELVKQYVKPI